MGKVIMLKTLRITGILTAVFAIVVFVFVAVPVVRADTKDDQILNSKSVMEEFKKAKGTGSRKTKDEKSPLVKEAESFAKYLNPPKPKPARKPSKTRKSKPKPRPKRVSVKFKLVGTSYYASNPDLSLALIDQPGKGLRWVRSGSKVGHLLIEKIADGSIMVKDGAKEIELVAERPPKKSLLRNKSGKEQTKTKSEITSTIATSQDEAEVSPRISEAESALMDAFIGKMKAAQQQDQPDVQQSGEGTAAMMEKLMTELAATRVDEQEAKRLDELGKALKGISPNIPDMNEVQRRKLELSKRRRRVRSPRQPRRPKSKKK